MMLIFTGLGVAFLYNVRFFKIRDIFHDFDISHICFLGLFWIGWVGWGLWLCFGTTTFRLSSSRLTIQRRFLGFTWGCRIERAKMTCFEQTQRRSDGLEGTNDPSWGLIVGEPNWHPLLGRESEEASDWLGHKLAEFYGVEFKPYSGRK